MSVSAPRAIAGHPASCAGVGGAEPGSEPARHQRRELHGVASPPHHRSLLAQLMARRRVVGDAVLSSPARARLYREGVPQDRSIAAVPGPWRDGDERPRARDRGGPPAGGERSDRPDRERPGGSGPSRSASGSSGGPRRWSSSTYTAAALAQQITWYLAVDQFGYLSFAHDLLHGHIFHTWAPLKALEPFFPTRTDLLAQTYVYDDGRLYCRYAPGFPLLLAGWVGLLRRRSRPLSEPDALPGPPRRRAGLPVARVPLAVARRGRDRADRALPHLHVPLGTHADTRPVGARLRLRGALPAAPGARQADPPGTLAGRRRGARLRHRHPPGRRRSTCCRRR